MPYKFNPFTSTFDYVSPPSGVTDPLVLNNLTVTSLLEANHIHGNIAGSLYIHVKNLDTVPLPKGTPFYISGTVGASDRVEIKAADNTDPSKGPAVGLVENTLAVNGEGNGVITGEIFQYDTATRGWQTNDALYVTASGGLSNIQPLSGYRQIVGYVGRVHELTGTIIVLGTGIDPVAGSDTQIQFNDNGGFGASVDLTWDDTSKKLGIGGDINLDDGGTYSTTLQVITPTADRVISFPNATGTLALVSGFSGQLIINRNGFYAGLAGSVVDTSNNVTLSSRLNISKSGSDLTSAATLTGTWPVNGTATTTKPQLLVEPTGTVSTAWSTSGTGLGVNAASGFAGNLLDLQLNGLVRARITSSGLLKLPNLPTYADNAAALSGGLVSGDVYKTATGELRITV